MNAFDTVYNSNNQRILDFRKTDFSKDFRKTQDNKKQLT